VPYRNRVVSGATGQVLEIGIGSGLNLPFYSQSVKQIVGIDPSPKLLEMAHEATTQSSLPVELMGRHCRSYSNRQRKHRYGRYDVDDVQHSQP
jgi:protein-L-isoaspartate O-methyltransferase